MYAVSCAPLACRKLIKTVFACAHLAVALATANASAETVRTTSSCEANLTCVRNTKMAVDHEFSSEPALSHWHRVPLKTEAAFVAPAANPIPPSLQDPTTGMKLVLVPGACYRTDGLKEQPVEVCLDPYYIGAYEVTFEEYERFSRETKRQKPEDEGWGRGRRPVINVSVYDALNFAKWLSRNSGAHYRLPTEVEWEHAARAGSATAYPWGNELGNNRANCDGCGSQWDDEQTAPVGSFAPNAWGLYDVVGNVGEWTCSMRDPDPAHSFKRCDSIFETRRRAYRNGGWDDDAERLATAFRDWNVAMRRVDDVGFRLVRECSECKSASPHPAKMPLPQGSETTETKMSLKTIVDSTAGSGVIDFASGVVADPGAELYKEKICYTCHGEDGTHPITQDYPVLAGQPTRYLMRQMKDIRDGRRTNGLSENMRAAVANVTDDEFEQIAAWLATRW
jgi:formylglycine-generating enzyme required for sulfatase activity/cytochrome c553